MSKDIYIKLREYLDTLASGFPETPTGVELKILKKLFTPEQAELTMRLTEEPESIADIAARIDVDEAELTPKLEEMAQKGLIYRVRKGDQRLYQASQFIIGIYEFQLKNLDKEFCELFEEYLPYYGSSIKKVKTKQLRVIPVESAIDTTSSVATYNKVRDLVKEQENIAVTQCICSKEQELLGNKCFKPQETCIGFGDFAQYYLDNNMARAINVGEALKLLDQAEEIGLVLQPTNTREIEAICCCCTCCCPSLRSAKMSKHPSNLFHSYYQAKIDPVLCAGCGECIDRCPMDAIREGEDISETIDGRCIGCGLCVSTCPETAISLIAKPDMEAPPMDFEETLKIIKTERAAIASFT